MNTILMAAKKKISFGERLNLEEALALYEENDLLYLAKIARKIKIAKSGRKVFYTINRHINLTNVCSSNCPLCAFSCQLDDPQAFTLEIEDVRKILLDAQRVKNLSEIHIVSALHPKKPFEYYLEVIHLVKNYLPRVAINAFTPVEIVNFSKLSGKSFIEILTILKTAGVTSLAGGGAEILSDRVRNILCPRKATANEWLEVMRIAHKLGIKTNASMLYGHIETISERFEHLIKLRELQDETNGFQALILFPFYPQNTILGQKFNLQRVTAWEDLKMLALSRILLDNFEHFKAFWLMLTVPVVQLALDFGADDLDGTMGEEKIIHATGATDATYITRDDLRKLIYENGYVPVERDNLYNEMKI